jgi:AcrR family transcriptional regulator
VATRTDLAERKRQLVRDELAGAALRLFAFHGFQATTIEQIVAAAGVSRRTFFRYFRTKDDVIVEFLGLLGRQVATELAVRPAEEDPATALRAAFRTFEDACTEHPEKARGLARLTFDTPAVRGTFLERQEQWSAALAAVLADRAGLDPAIDVRPALWAAVALSALNAAIRRWARDEGADPLDALDVLVDEAFAVVAPALR